MFRECSRPPRMLLTVALPGLLLVQSAVAFAWRTTAWPATTAPVGAVEQQAAVSSSEAAASADLRLEWLLEERPTRKAPVIEGSAGEVILLPYRVRNVGGRDAFALVIRADTALGAVGAPERLEPGPEAGEAVQRSLALPLAAGMRELCLEARLQNRRAEDPPDPNTEDNRICRRVEVEHSLGAGRSLAGRAVPLRATLGGPR